MLRTRLDRFGVTNPAAHAGLLVRPDSKQIALVAENQALVLDVDTGKEVLYREPAADRAPAPWHSLAILPDGRVWTTVLQGKSVVVWDLTNQRQVREITPSEVDVKMLEDYPRMRLLSADGRWLLLQPPPDQPATLPYMVWEIATGREVLRFGPPAPAAPTLQPGAIWSADGQRLLTWQAPIQTDADARLPDRTASVMAVPSGKLLLEVRDNSLNNNGDLSIDGRYLVLGHHDGSARVWDVERAMELFHWYPVPGRVPEFLGTNASGGPAAGGILWADLYMLDLPALRRELAALSLDW